MKQSIQSFFLASTFSVLTACGGGGGDSGNNNAGNTNSAQHKVINNPTDYSKLEVEKAYKAYLQDSYTGSSDKADVSLANIQTVYKLLWGDDYTDLPSTWSTHNNLYNLNSQLLKPLQQSLQTPKLASRPVADAVLATLNEQEKCAESGSIKYKGDLTENDGGIVEVEFLNCRHNYYSPVVTGKSTVFVETSSNNAQTYTVFYNDVIITTLDDLAVTSEKKSLTGYVQSAIRFDAKHNSNYLDIDQNLLIKNLHDNEEFLFNINNFLHQPEGRIYLSDLGYIDISSSMENNNFIYGTDGEMKFTGNSTAVLHFEDHHTKYLLDQNNDGDYEKGVYFAQSPHFSEQDISDLVLTDPDKLSLPPIVHRPYIDSHMDFYTSSPIFVHQGYISDPDTDNEQLTISYRWYINDELLENQTGVKLPPYTAVYGDRVQVSMLVSDGANTIESGLSSEIFIEDSPAQFSVSNVPSDIKVGDDVSFNVTITDPDTSNSPEVTYKILNAPKGTTIDKDGVVSWTANQDVLLPEQTFYFTFALDNNAESVEVENSTVPVTITSDSPMPLTRSGIKVPNRNNAIWVGDFRGNGKNEVLTMGENQSVFLISENEDKYQQSWMYPFAMPTKGNIVQVIGHNINDDTKSEIIVITDLGISLIDDISKMASKLLETDHYIHSAVIGNLQNNDELFIAFLSSEDKYSNSDKNLNLFKLDDLSNPLINTSIGEANSISIGNVDTDPQAEIILNNGLVYDGLSYENQWLSSNQFGTAEVITADLDNDGIDEIIGANKWDSLKVYSAVNKAQLYSFDNFNACNIIKANIDVDAADELIVENCQRGNIAGYDWSNNELQEKWSVGSHHYGTSSIAVGDSDNDGLQEIHWSTGQSSSDKDQLAVADINNSSAELKSTNTAIQLDYFSSAGWIEVEPENEKAVFFVPQTNNGYAGGRVLTLDDKGNYQLSQEISSNWDHSSHAAVTDYNNDGYGDIFLPNTNLYDGSFGAYQLSNMSLIWQVSGNYDDDIGLIAPYKLNDDEYTDVIYSNERKIQALDVENQLIIANYTFDDYIRDFLVTSFNNEKRVVVSSNSKIHLLKKNSNSFTEMSSVEKSCKNIILINYDEDPQQELLCTNHSDYTYSNNANQITIYEIENDQMVEKASHNLTVQIHDIVVDTSTENNQSLYAIAENDDLQSYNYHHRLIKLVKLDHDGNLLWSSPDLIGNAVKKGLLYRYINNQPQFMLSTTKAMYLINY